MRYKVTVYGPEDAWDILAEYEEDLYEQIGAAVDADPLLDFGPIFEAIGEVNYDKL